MFGVGNGDEMTETCCDIVHASQPASSMAFRPVSWKDRGKHTLQLLQLDLRCAMIASI